MRKTLFLLLSLLLSSTSQMVSAVASNNSEQWSIVEWSAGPKQVIINNNLTIANRWPQWLNFNVKAEDESSAIMEMKFVILTGETGNAFFHFMECVEPDGWYAVPDEFDSNKNPTVIYFRSTDPEHYIRTCETGKFGVRFSYGPSSCRYNFAVYIIDAGTGTKKSDLYVCIDNLPPIVDKVWAEPIPDAKFPDNVFKHVTRILICAQVHDPAPHPSGVKEVKLYLRLTDPEKRGPWNMEWDPGRQAWCLLVENDTHLWESEQWYIPSAEASDAVCNTGEEKEGESFFFCWEPPIIEIWDLNRDRGGIQVHVDQDIAVNLTTGFTPDAEFTISFDNTLVKEGTTDKRGRALTTFVVPEVPRGFYRVRVVDEYDNGDEKNVEVIPWVWPEENQFGPVGHKIYEFRGKGFKENTWVDIIYRDFWKGNVYPETTSDRNATHEIFWSPHLDELILTSITTDSKGSFMVEIEIPDSYGGLHPVYAEERTDHFRSFNSMFVHVRTTIWVDPSVGLREQYITLYSSGLPLPHYSLRTQPWTGKLDDPVIYNERDWCLALDFGPRQKWLWENKRIINGFFESDWFLGQWWSVSYACTVDPKSHVWSGKLCWRDSEGIYHIGCPFIKVPVLSTDVYQIKLYQFGVNDGTKDKAEHGIDHYEYEASTDFSIVTNPIPKSAPGDVNGDGALNIYDVYKAGKAYASKPGDYRWASKADMNQDGIISICDVFIIVSICLRL